LQYAQRGGQVFVSTHSPQFLNAVPLESLYHIDKTEGVSRIVAIANDPLISAQIKAGDLAGYLWEQGLFKGVTQRIVQR
jgi:predicted ATPase